MYSLLCDKFQGPGSRKASSGQETTPIAPAILPESKDSTDKDYFSFHKWQWNKKSQLFFLYTVCLNYLTLYLAPKGEIDNIPKQGSKYYRSISFLTHRGGFLSVVQVIRCTVKCTRSDRPDRAETGLWLS